MQHAVRNLGRVGIAAMAIGAVDAALWDLKARLLHLPLVTLLGAVRDRVPVYGSGGFTSYPIAQLQEQLGGWVAGGIPRVKMKIGRDAAADPERVRAAPDYAYMERTHNDHGTKTLLRRSTGRRSRSSNDTCQCIAGSYARFNRINPVGPVHAYLLRVNAFPEWTTIAGSPR
jgi:hypothetical protein